MSPKVWAVKDTNFKEWTEETEPQMRLKWDLEVAGRVADKELGV